MSKKRLSDVIEVVGDGSERVAIEKSGYHRPVYRNVVELILEMMSERGELTKKDFLDAGLKDDNHDRVLWTFRVLEANGVIKRRKLKGEYHVRLTREGCSIAASKSYDDIRGVYRADGREYKGRPGSKGDARRGETGEDNLSADLEEIGAREVKATEKVALILARLGQGQFRRDVLKHWGNRCAVTGIETVEAIRASHIKPWRNSDEQERVDPSNGLPLVASLDALFDAGLISFRESGQIVISSLLNDTERERFGLGNCRINESDKLKGPTAKYLRYHSTTIFKK